MKKKLAIILIITLLLCYIPQPVSAAVPKSAFKVTGNELGYKIKAEEGSPSGIRDGWIQLYNIVKGTGTSGCTVKAVVNKKTYQAKVNKQGRFTLYIPVQKTIYEKVTLKAGTKIKVTEYKGKKKVKTITAKAQKKGKHDKLINEKGIDYKWILSTYDRLMTEYLAEYSEAQGYELKLAWSMNYKKQYPRTNDDVTNGGAGFQLLGYDKKADVMVKMSERAIAYDMLVYAQHIMLEDVKDHKLEKGKSYLYFNNYYYEGYNKWHAYGASARRGDKSQNIKSYNFWTDTGSIYDAETLMEAEWAEEGHPKAWVEKTDAYGKDVYYVNMWEGMPT